MSHKLPIWFDLVCSTNINLKIDSYLSSAPSCCMILSSSIFLTPTDSSFVLTPKSLGAAPYHQKSPSLSCNNTSCIETPGIYACLFSTKAIGTSRIDFGAAGSGGRVFINTIDVKPAASSSDCSTSRCKQKEILSFYSRSLIINYIVLITMHFVSYTC